jgi:DNA gyrase subunit A
MENDQLVSVQAVTGENELLIASNNGKCVRFSENDVRTLGRSSRGVKGMKIDEGEKIIDMIVLNPDKDILTVTELGYAKRTKVEDYRLQSRRGKGTKAGRFNDKTGDIVAIKPIEPNQDIIAITSNGIVIRTHAEQINEVSRTALGVKLMNTSGCKIVGVSIVEKQEDDEDIETADKIIETQENSNE